MGSVLGGDKSLDLLDRPLAAPGTSSTTSGCILMMNQASSLLGSNDADPFLVINPRAHVNMIVHGQASVRMLPCMHNNRAMSSQLACWEALCASRSSQQA